MSARRPLDVNAASLTDAMSTGLTRVPRMPRRVVNVLIHLVRHDAHHRGQISALAKDLGDVFQPDEIIRLWGWKKL